MCREQQLFLVACSKKCAAVQEASGSQAEAISFHHAAAEHTQLPDSSQDLVSACLLFHELPQSAAQEIVQEAYRILKPGGALAIMVWFVHAELQHIA